MKHVSGHVIWGAEVQVTPESQNNTVFWFNCQNQFEQSMQRSGIVIRDDQNLPKPIRNIFCFPDY